LLTKGLTKGLARALLACTLLMAPYAVIAAAPVHAEVSAGGLSLARQAIKAAEDGKEDEARRIARKVGDPLLLKIVTWIDLGRPDTSADYQTLVEFLKNNADWPNKDAIRRNAELLMPALPPAEVVRWYDANPPLTLTGFYRYVDALLAQDLSERAIALVRRRYVDGSFGATDERDFRQKFTALLRPEDNEARLDRLLWDEDAAGAKRLMPLVLPEHQTLAEARLALQTQAPGAERLIAKVPASLANDPGLLYERARWRRRKDMDEEALAILEHPPRDMVRPTAWWTERHILARNLLEKADYARAYKLVANHGVPEGLAFTQAEFLAGFIALKFLNQPDQALKHFEALYRNVKTPLSLTRGAYWAGRAAKAMGDPEPPCSAPPSTGRLRPPNWACPPMPASRPPRRCHRPPWPPSTGRSRCAQCGCCGASRATRAAMATCSCAASPATPRMSSSTT
jgi:soluble lytic murein transglycosylase